MLRSPEGASKDDWRNAGGAASFSEALFDLCFRVGAVGRQRGMGRPAQTVFEVPEEKQLIP